MPETSAPSRLSAAHESRRIALLYLAAALVWILATDLLVARGPIPPGWHETAQLLKGILFILVTSGVLYWLIERVLQRRDRLEREMETARIIYQDLSERYRERTKERTCIYEVGETLNAPGSLDEGLARVPEILPLGMRYPELGMACVSIGDREFSTDGWEQTPWTLDAAIEVQGKKVGAVAVGYRDEPPGKPDFLPEEVEMIEHIAAKIGASLQKAEVERALARSEAYFRAITENTTDLTTVFDAEGEILYESPAVERTLGVPAERRVGGSIFERIHPDDRREVRRLLAEKGREPGALVHLSFRARHLDGSWRWLESTAKNLADDPAVGGIVAHSRDVTDRLEAEARTRFHARLLNEIEQAVVVSDLDGETGYWNRAAGQMLGIGRDRALGVPVSELLEIENGDITLATVVKEAIDTGRYAGEVTLSRRDDTLPVHLSVTCYRADESGAGTIFVITDLSEERALQLQLQRAQKMEAVGRLAGGIAHDFNNILTGIRGFAQMAADGVQPDHPVHEDLEEICRSTDRAVELTRQLLAFGRRQVLEPKVVDLNRSVLKMRRMLEKVAGDAVDFSVDLADHLPSVCVDEGQLEQVVVNLVVNARDAVDHGRIVVRTREVQVAKDMPTEPSGMLRRGHYAAIDVEDDGTGIPPGVMDRIFEPFFTTKDETKGTGLGLSTAYGIVEQSDGTFEVRTAPGQGSRFTIYLPVARDGHGEPAPAPSPGVVENGSVFTQTGEGTVLLVEDDSAVRVLVRRILNREGFDVLEAETPEAAMRLAEAHGKEIVLVLSDMVMPEMNGPELLGHVRPHAPDARTILMSGHAAEEVVRKADAAADHFIAKPFAPRALLETIRAVMNG